MPKTKKKNGIVINGLNTRQRMFVKSYVEHKGNGTKAAMEVYQAKNDASAAAIASEMLKNPKITRAIDIALSKEGVQDIGEYLKSKTTDIIESGTTEPKLASTTVKDSMEAMKLLAKLHNIAQSQPSNVSLHKHYHGMTKTELLEERSKHRNLIDGILDETNDTV